MKGSEIKPIDHDVRITQVQGRWYNSMEPSIEEVEEPQAASIGKPGKYLRKLSLCIFRDIFFLLTPENIRQSTDT